MYGANVPPAIRNAGKPAAKPSVQRVAAQKAAPRYLNRASGKMETAQQMHNYRPPAQGHVVSRTQHTVRRETTTTPAQRTPSLLEMTPAQIQARAQQIVQGEINAERVPFQQRSTQLAGEEQGALAAHATDYGKLEAEQKAAQAANAESAKTFQNQAADMVKRASEQNPGAAATAEHLGGATGAPGGQLAQQQEAARNLLTAIATGAQAGTLARQQAGSNLMGSYVAGAAAENTAGGKQIQGEYGKRKQEVGNQEAQLLAGAAGRTGKLGQAMQGETEKLRIAEQGLGLKGQEAERHAEETKSDIQNRRAGQAVARQKLANEGRRIEADAAYKRASVQNKQQKDALDIQKKELEIRKLIEAKPGSKPLTTQEVNTYAGEMGKSFQFFKRAREEGASPQEIQQELEQGQGRRSYQVVNGKTKKTETKHYTEKFTAIKNPVFIQAAIDMMQKEYISAKVKAQLREMGLPDSGWSEKFISHPATPKARGKRPA